jgi:hypothetical protein
MTLGHYNYTTIQEGLVTTDRLIHHAGLSIITLYKQYVPLIIIMVYL